MDEDENIFGKKDEEKFKDCEKCVKFIAFFVKYIKLL